MRPLRTWRPIAHHQHRNLIDGMFGSTEGMGGKEFLMERRGGVGREREMRQGRERGREGRGREGASKYRILEVGKFIG